MKARVWRRSPNAISVHERLEVEPMKASTRNRAEGKLREVEAALKEAVAAAAKDRDLELERKREKRVGKVQGAVGRIEKAVGR
jgi:uncharacterized protein YjbJ (UPF0337 family)